MAAARPVGDKAPDNVFLLEPTKSEEKCRKASLWAPQKNCWLPLGIEALQGALESRAHKGPRARPTEPCARLKASANRPGRPAGAVAWRSSSRTRGFGGLSPDGSRREGAPSGALLKPAAWGTSALSGRAESHRRMNGWMAGGSHPFVRCGAHLRAS